MVQLGCLELPGWVRLGEECSVPWQLKPPYPTTLQENVKTTDLSIRVGKAVGPRSGQS